MDDDEKHFIVGVKLSFDEAERGLKGEKSIDSEIAAIVGRLLIALERAFHRRSVVKAVTSDK
jgi:uncharacterized membrane protein